MKLYCGKCGSFMAGESGTSHTMKVHRYYHCVNTKKKKLCDKKAVKKDWIEDLVVNYTMKVIMDDEVMEWLIDSFVNAVCLYEDKIILTFNHKDGFKTIMLAEIEGSDLSILSALKMTHRFFKEIYELFFYPIFVFSHCGSFPAYPQVYIYCQCCSGVVK